MNIFQKQVFYLKQNFMIDTNSELEWIGRGLRISALRRVLPSDASHRCQRQDGESYVCRQRV